MAPLSLMVSTLLSTLRTHIFLLATLSESKGAWQSHNAKFRLYSDCPFCSRSLWKQTSTKPSGTQVSLRKSLHQFYSKASAWDSLTETISDKEMLVLASKNYQKDWCEDALLQMSPQSIIFSTPAALPVMNRIGPSSSSRVGKKSVGLKQDTQVEAKRRLLCSAVGRSKACDKLLRVIGWRLFWSTCGIFGVLGVFGSLEMHLSACVFCPENNQTFPENQPRPAGFIHHFVGPSKAKRAGESSPGKLRVAILPSFHTFRM